MHTSLQESFPIGFTGLTCVKLNGSWARQIEDSRNGGGGAGRLFFSGEGSDKG